MTYPEPTSRLRFVVNDDELVGEVHHGLWYFTTTIGDVIEYHPGCDDPAPIIEQFTRSAIAADAGIVPALLQLSEEIRTVVEGGVA